MIEIIDRLETILQEAENILDILTDSDEYNDDRSAWIVQVVEEISECAGDLLKSLR